jgi:hypothetical protein
MDVFAEFQRAQRVARRQRNLGEWCEKAKDIDAAMVSKHSTRGLSLRATFRLARNLEREQNIHRMGRIIDGEPSGKAIKRQLSEIQNSIERIANFARDVEAAERAIGRGIHIDADCWEKRGAVEAMQSAGQRWEMGERAQYEQDMERWRRSPERDRSETPQDRLEGHIEMPVVTADGYTSHYTDVMVRNWFKQARFIKEILKDPDIATRHLDELNWPTAEASLAGSRMPTLFKKTYPRLTFGSAGRDGSFRNAAGYTFTVLAIEAIAGRTIAANTIRTHIKNTKGSAGRA